MTVKLLTDHHLEFLSLKGGCTGLSESTHVKTPHCWKSHVVAHFTCIFCLTGELIGNLSEAQYRTPSSEVISDIEQHGVR